MTSAFTPISILKQSNIEKNQLTNFFISPITKALKKYLIINNK